MGVSLFNRFMFIHLFIPYFTMLVHHIALWYCTMLQQNRFKQVLKQVLKQDQSGSKTGSFRIICKSFNTKSIFSNLQNQPLVSSNKLIIMEYINYNNIPDI